MAHEPEPPEAPPLFTTSPKSILEDAERVVETSRNALNHIAESVDVASATFNNVLLPLAHAENALMSQAYILGFYQYVSTDEGLREASRKAEKIFDDYNREWKIREDIYVLVDAVKTNTIETSALDPESEHFLNRVHHDFIKNGMKLPRTEREHLRQIQTRITELAAEFGDNSSRGNEGGLWFTPEELQGIPEDRLAELQKGFGENEGKLFTSFLEDVSLVLRFAGSSETRKKMRVAYDHRCRENVPLFREVVVLRDEAARLLGYPNHAALELEEKVAKTPETVNALLSDLLAKLRPLGLKELEKYKAVKQKDLESRGEIWDGRYYLWDQPYYNTKLLAAEYSLDHEAVAEYFPLESTVKSILEIVEQLFGLVFREISSDAITLDVKKARVWHEDVQLFGAWDDETGGAGFLGYLYLDLYTMSFKPGPSTFPLVPGYLRPGGTRNYPSVALLCNFPKPTPKIPSLLPQGDVVTLFHELGHGIHDLVSKTVFARFHGPQGTAVDFGEAPSQMLENWCWVPSQLKLLSRHYSSLSPEYLTAWQGKVASKGSTTPPEIHIPDARIDNLTKAENVYRALSQLNELAICFFDMAIHQPETHEAIEKMDISATFNRLHRECFPLDGLGILGEEEKYGHPYTRYRNFIKGDYHAGYYGYFLSNIFSADIFESCFKGNLQNGAEGRRYRHVLLEKGESRPEMEFIVALLGRQPDPTAFLKESGLV